MSSVNVTTGFGAPDTIAEAAEPAATNLARSSLGLEGLMERAAQACPEAAASPVVDFAFGGKWLAARLRDGSCGRAFTFM